MPGVQNGKCGLDRGLHLNYCSLLQTFAKHVLIQAILLWDGGGLKLLWLKLFPVDRLTSIDCNSASCATKERQAEAELSQAQVNDEVVVEVRSLSWRCSWSSTTCPGGWVGGGRSDETKVILNSTQFRFKLMLKLELTWQKYRWK